MARPCKKKRVCGRPPCVWFGPGQAAGREKPKQYAEAAGQAGAETCMEPETPPESEICAESVVMTLEEYECIRLMDHEGMNQEQCARQMEAARTTIQAIYQSARKKLAICLVEGRRLRIGGGSFRLCEKRKECCKGYCGHENL